MPPPAPVVVVSPAVTRVAMYLADGDRSRLHVNGDGSVTVENRPQRNRP